MQSTSFIKAAQTLIRKIKDNPMADVETIQEIQREISQLYSGLQNPTLPSASALREAAVSYGYTVDPRVLQRLDQADRFWQA